jgi:hypothetical protein
MIDSRLLPCAHCKHPEISLFHNEYNGDYRCNEYTIECNACPSLMIINDCTEQEAIDKWNTRGGVLQTASKRVTFRYHASKSWHCFSNDEIEIAFTTVKDAFVGLTEYLESSNKLGVIKVIATPEDGISPVEFLAYAANCQLYNSNCCLSFDIRIA